MVPGEVDHTGRVLAKWQDHRPDLDLSPLAVIGRVHTIAERLNEVRGALYAEYGVGTGEFEVLVALLRCGPPFEMTPTELADWSVVSSGAVTKRVDRCIEQDWVTRRAGERDGRIRVVALTEEGHALASAIFEAQTDTLHRVVAGLDEDERTQLAALLEKWGRTLEA